MNVWGLLSFHISTYFLDDPKVGWSFLCPIHHVHATDLCFVFSLVPRLEEGVRLCESLLEACPVSCELRDALADLHHRQGNGEQAVTVWLHALAECPNNAQIFYHTCRFLMAQVSAAAGYPRQPIPFEVHVPRNQRPVIII